MGSLIHDSFRVHAQWSPKNWKWKFLKSCFSLMRYPFPSNKCSCTLIANKFCLLAFINIKKQKLFWSKACWVKTALKSVKVQSKNLSSKSSKQGFQKGIQKIIEKPLLKIFQELFMRFKLSVLLFYQSGECSPDQFGIHEDKEWNWISSQKYENSNVIS